MGKLVTGHPKGFFVLLTEEILSEEVAGKIMRSYTYAPWGQRFSMTHHEQGETFYYGTNTRDDVAV
ncbi:hypothetical protein [Mechercharimyces sp. CAU 1602]|uniref:hypothetical protein n=1 Tax=Mechercharimyces sp. CAU 1602 TaxID=2973933 RepID=UPI002161AF6A|nr:hypothetical protein [Mechercharimyces sp. CAU 1602]MCS1350878.1 hypothetical protein [Mechercharimyces sp. CAU 1602]